MNEAGIKAFNLADSAIHPVEKEWHFPIMSEAGFVAETKDAVGFVRSYRYSHPAGHTITATTGASADYWTDAANKEFGYWRGLEPHLAKLTA